MPFRRFSKAPLAIIILALLSLSLFVQTGCAPAMQPEPAWELDAGSLLDQADSQLAKKQYEAAQRALDAFFRQYPTSKHRDRALYTAGEIRFTLRDFQKARTFYQELIKEFPSSSFAADSRFRLGQCYFELKEYDLVISTLEDRKMNLDLPRLRRVAEMLSTAYTARKKNLSALKEFLYLAETAPAERQRTGYLDRVREIVDKQLTEDELKTLSAESAFPADIARLRLAGLQFEERQYRGVISLMQGFLEKFPNHAERTRAEMLLNDATLRLSSPRYAIGALLPQSGQLAFFGDRVLKGVQLAVHSYNTRNPENRVELIVKDTEGSSDKAVAGLNELASKNVLATVGPLLTKEVEAIAPLLEKLKMPVITPAASGEDIGKLSAWLFRNALTNASQATAAAQYALGRAAKKIVIFHSDETSGRDLTKIFTRALDKKADILASISYPPDVKDFGPYIRRVIEIDLKSRKIQIPEDDAERKKLFQEYTPSIDAFYLPGNAERVGLLIPQLAFYNMSGITMIGSNSWHTPDLIERAQKYAEGAVFVDGFFPESPDPAVKGVIDAYRSAYNEDPDIYAAQAYDAISYILSCLKDHKDTSQAIRDCLASLKDFPGISGSTTFAGNGDAQKKLFLIRIQDGKFTLNTD